MSERAASEDPTKLRLMLEVENPVGDAEDEDNLEDEGEDEGEEEEVEEGESEPDTP